MKSQSDIKKTVPANGLVNIPTRGEFVFLKNANSKIKVIIGGETVEMEAGDVRKVPQPFNEFEIKNETGIDQTVELVAGFGDYNRLVVRGDISSFPSVMGSDGVARPDTRSTIAIDLGFIDPTQYHEEIGDELERLTPIISGYEISEGANRGAAYNNDRSEFWVSYNAFTVRHDAVTGAYIGLARPFDGLNGDRVFYLYHPEYGTLVTGDQSRQYWTTTLDGGRDEQVFNFSSYAPSADYGARFTADGKAIFMHSQNLWVVDAAGVTVHDGVVLMDLIGLPYFYDLKLAWADPDSGDHIYATHGNHKNIYRINIVTGETVQVADGMPQYGSWGQDRIDYNFATGNVEAGQNYRAKLAVKTADYWGKIASMRAGDSGVMLRAESSAVEVNTTIPGQSYDQITRYFNADWIRIALEKYYKARAAKEVPKNYLDYVFGITINGELLEGGSYESFLRQGVTDFFSSQLPARVELTVSKELKYL